MICFASFLPHPLLSVPDIGKAHYSKFRKTVRTYKTIAHELYAAKPDCIIVLTPHGIEVPGTIGIYQRPHTTIDFNEFGDLSDHFEATIDIATGYRIKEASETLFPIRTTDAQRMDYGTGVIYVNVIRQLPHTIPLVPICLGDVPFDTLYAFGEHLSTFAHTAQQRIAIIGTGDLSHGSSKSSPTGYSAKAAQFNAAIKALFAANNFASLRTIIADVASQETQECSSGVLMTLNGLLHETNLTSETLSYETAFGVGYLSVQFHFA